MGRWVLGWGLWRKREKVYSGREFCVWERTAAGFADAHLSDDEAVAKMGHRTIWWLGFEAVGELTRSAG
jgi:hypothetical protein